MQLYQPYALSRLVARRGRAGFKFTAGEPTIYYSLFLLLFAIIGLNNGENV
jgi:hypothetical protein